MDVFGLKAVALPHYLIELRGFVLVPPPPEGACPTRGWSFQTQRGTNGFVDVERMPHYSRGGQHVWFNESEQTFLIHEGQPADRLRATVFDIGDAFDEIDKTQSPSYPPKRYERMGKIMLTC